MAFIAGNLFAADKQRQNQKVPTLFELCVNHVYRIKDDAPYPLENIGMGIAASDERLCNKVLRHILRRDGLDANISTVKELIQLGASLNPELTLQGLIRNADNNAQNHECPIDVINPGPEMKVRHYIFLDVLQKYGLNFNKTSGQQLVSRAINNENEDFVRYAVAHGLNIPQYLQFLLRNNDSRVFNCMSKQLCFKECRNNCAKIHQTDNPYYHFIAKSKSASPVIHSAFFQAYAFRHACEQQYLLDLVRQAVPKTHKLFAVGLTKEDYIAIYKPNALEHDWIIKTDPNHAIPVRVHTYTVGDETSYTFLWDKHTLTFPYPSSGIAASLTQQEVRIDRLHPAEQEALLQCRPSRFNEIVYKDMGLEIFYHDSTK